MSYDPRDDEPVEVEPQDGGLDERFGGDMMNAVNEVLVNVFQERWRDDDEQLAVVTLAEAYTSAGYSADRIKAYAASEVRGYSYEAIDQLTYGALLEAGLWEPVNW